MSIIYRDTEKEKLEKFIQETSGLIDDLIMLREGSKSIVYLNDETDKSIACFNRTLMNFYKSVEAMQAIGKEIRICKRCGKPFLASNRNRLYCDRLNQNGDSCSSIGPGELFRDKLREEEALEAYNRAYKTHHARYRKGKMSLEAMKSWRRIAKHKLDSVRIGELSLEEFKLWLKW